MAWLTGWKRRVAVTLNMGAKAGAGTTDAEVVLDSTWDEFWGLIDTDGDEIRITKADGTTALTYQWKAGTFSKANKTGTIEIDNAPHTVAPSVTLIWLYYDQSGAASGAGVFVAAAPVSGYIDLLVPAQVVRAERQRPGQTTPTTTIAGTEASILSVCFDLRDMLRPRVSAHDSRLHGEEILEMTASVRDTSDVVVANTIDIADSRFTTDRLYRSGLASVLVDAPAGSLDDGSNYAISVVVYTTASQVYEARAGLSIRDVRPTT
jgi:hypothetical protein